MQLEEALKSSPIVRIGVEARAVTRKDRRGRRWFLFFARDKYFLVRYDRGGARRVDIDFVGKWNDWRPQSEQDAQRESEFLNGKEGFGLRNALLGMVMGPITKEVCAPDILPNDVC